MEEIKLSPEVQELLPKAVREVEGLYMGDLLTNLLRTKTSEERDEIWREAAQKFPPFTEKINKLREELKSAEVTKKGYPEQLTEGMSLHFSKVEDETATALLTDLLFARTMQIPGYMDYKMNVYKEAEAMATELGVQEGLQGEKMKGITLDDVIESVLTGKLKLSRQT